MPGNGPTFDGEANASTGGERSARQAWQVSGCSEFHWQEIDGEWLVYHLGRYQYHLLDVATALVFDALQQIGPADLEALCIHLRQVSASVGVEIDPAAVRAVLDRLRSADLVEPCLP